MMKQFLLAAAMAVAGPLCAQNPRPMEIRSGDPDRAGSNPTEMMFNNPEIGKGNYRYYFWLGKGNRLSVEFTSINQASRLPDLDSLIRAGWRTLQPFTDTLSKPLVSRRVDVVFGKTANQVRLLEYPQQGVIYRVGGQDTAQLKIAQDTLHLKYYTTAPIPKYLLPLYERSGWPTDGYTQPLEVVLLLNNITDAANLTTADIAWAQRTLEAHADSMKKAGPRALTSPYWASYNAATRQRINDQPYRVYNRFHAPVPSFEVNVGLVRGAWAPGVGIGLMYEHRPRLHEQNTFRLLWEPLFFFNKTGDVTRMERNDFITFKYSEKATDPKDERKMQFYQTMSVGYMIRHRGDWLQPRTIKFGLPGVDAYRFRVEPEFYFNDLFKNFSPSLKFTIVFE